MSGPRYARSLIGLLVATVMVDPGKNPHPVTHSSRNTVAGGVTAMRYAG
jgi:hypothetical protein